MYKPKLNKSQIPKRSLVPTSRLVLICLSTLCLATNARADITTNSGAAYATECSSKGVPLPPAWGSSSWISRGELENGKSPGERDFNIVGSDPAFVYTFSNATGVCYALPRVNATTLNQTIAFGVICQGKSGKACFWEKGTTSWPMATNTSITGTFRGGTDLTQADACANCHSGANAFIIHKDSKLDIPSLDVSTTSGWYEPIIPAIMAPAGFVQNPRPPTTPDKFLTVPSNQNKCTLCHTSSANEFPLYSMVSGGDARAILPDATFSSPTVLPMMPPVPYTAANFAASTDHMKNVQAKGSITTASVTRGSERIDNFLLDPAGNLYHVWWNTTSWLWERINIATTNPLVGGLAAASWGNNRIDLITYDSARNFIWIYFDGSAWFGQNLGNGFGYTSFSMAPTAASWGVNRIDAFVQGTDGNIRQLWYDGTWHWANLGNSWGGTKFKAMTAISWGFNRIDVIGPAWNAQVKQLTWSNGWTWNDLGPVAGRWTGPVAGVAQASNRIDVVGTNVDGSISRLNWNGVSWTWATTLANPWDAGLYGPIAISSWASGRLDIVGPALDGQIKHMWRNTATSPNWNFSVLGNRWK